MIAFLILYPTISMFLGLDLGDTGFHMYAYVNFFRFPDKINYTMYFTAFIGWLWNQIFGGFGLIAMNALEVVLELTMTYIVFKIFSPLLGRIATLMGLCFASLGIGTYLNIFNYHQANVFFLLLIFACIYRAMFESKLRFSLLAGLAYSACVMARVGSVVALIALLLYAVMAIRREDVRKMAWKHIGFFLIGTFAGALICLLPLIVTGGMDRFVNNIFRLKKIAGDESTGYGFTTLLRGLISDNLRVMVSGFSFLFASVFTVVGSAILFSKQDKASKRILYAIIALATIFFGVVQIVLAYHWIPTERWAQMTSGPRFTVGIFYICTWCLLLYTVIHEGEKSDRLLTVSLSALMLVVLCIAGSNTKTKHVVLAYWLIGPTSMYFLFRIFFHPRMIAFYNALMKKGRIVCTLPSMVLAFVLVFSPFVLKFGSMAYHTTNFDNPNRLLMQATVDSPRVRFIRTTKEEAAALDGLLKAVKNEPKGEELLMFGSANLLYYLTGMDAYLQPWVTAPGYSLTAMRDELTKKESQGKLPLVIWCKSDYMRGFHKADIERNQKIERYRNYRGKKEVVIDFLNRHGYGVLYMNDFFAVLKPDLDWSVSSRPAFYERLYDGKYGK